MATAKVKPVKKSPKTGSTRYTRKARSFLKRLFGLGKSQFEVSLEDLDEDSREIFETFRLYLNHCKKKKELASDWEKEWESNHITLLRSSIDQAKRLTTTDLDKEEDFVRAIVHAYHRAMEMGKIEVGDPDETSKLLKRVYEYPRDHYFFLGIEQELLRLKELFKMVEKEIDVQSKFLDKGWLGKQIKEMGKFQGSVNVEWELIQQMRPIIEDLFVKVHKAIRRIDNWFRVERSYIDAAKKPFVLNKSGGKVRLKAAVVYEPFCGVGGDFYSCSKLGKNLAEVVIGDACGKGLPADKIKLNFGNALQQAKNRVADEGDRYYGIKKVEALVSSFFKYRIRPGKFITLFMLLFDFKSGLISCFRAGHSPGFVVTKSNKVERLGHIPSAPLCASTSSRVKEFLGKLKKHNDDEGLSLGLPLFPYTIYDLKKIVLYTDGVTEQLKCEGQESGEDKQEELKIISYTDEMTEQQLESEDQEYCEEYGEDRLEEFIDANKAEGCEKLARMIRDDVDKFRGPRNRHDDLTIVVLDLDFSKTT